MTNGLQAQIYEFEEFRLDAVKRLLLRGDEAVIPLTPKIFDTLLYFVRNNQKVIEKDELMREIWTDTIVEENNLNKNISVLRRVLGEKPGEHRFIVTVPGHGYKFVADVHEKSDLPVLSGGETAAQSDSFQTPLIVRHDEPRTSNQISKSKEQPSNKKRETRFWLATIIIAAVAGLSFLGFYPWRADKPSDTPITSVAVLPFVNVGADPEMEYLSDGISESLIDRLSELPQLKVIARSSSFKYRGENIDLRDAATKLDVQAIITGRVVRRDDNLLIRVELVDARDNKQLWGAEFNRKAADALLMQREIAQIVSEKMRLKLSGAEERQIAKRETVNPQAYELLLKGRFARKGGRESLKKTIDYFQQAVEVDPSYALAYSELSFSYSLLMVYSLLDPKDVMLKAKAAAQKALELDESLADAHFVLAVIRQNEWDWANAESEFKRAIELNPNLARAHMLYSGYLSIMGRHEQSITEGKRGKELDPLSPRININYGAAFIEARQYDQGIEIVKKTFELNPTFGGTHSALGAAYLGKGMSAEAVAEFQEAIKLDGDSPTLQIYLGAAYTRAGKREKAEAILKHLETSKEFVAPGELAVLYTSLGDREKAFATLEKAFSAHDAQLQYLKVEPLFDPLHDDPRFQDLLRRVGLPQ